MIIVDMVEGYHIVHSNDKEDYDHTFYKDICLIVDYYIIVHQRLSMLLQQAKVSKVETVWIHIPHLSQESYNSRFFLTE